MNVNKNTSLFLFFLLLQGQNLLVSAALAAEEKPGRAFLAVDEAYIVTASNISIYGSSGEETASLNPGITRVLLDQNIEQLILPGASTDYAFQQTGNRLNIYDIEGVTLIARFPVQRDETGTLVTFGDRALSATLESSGSMKLGVSTVRTTISSLAQIINPAGAIADNLTASVNEGESITIHLSSNMPANEGRSYQIVSSPSLGFVSQIDADQVTYFPYPGYSGNDSFSYTVTYFDSTSEPAMVDVTINPVAENQLTALDQIVKVVTNSKAIIVLEGKKKAESDVLNYLLDAPPQHGQLSVFDGNRVTYTPNADYEGDDSFTFKVSDGVDTSASGLITLQVKPIGTVYMTSEATVISKEEIPQIDTLLALDDGNMQLKTIPQSVLASGLGIGNVITILPGEDERYPLGFVGKIVDSWQNADGSTEFTLESASLADVVEEAQDQVFSMPLTSDNFIGVISPSMVESSAVGMVLAKSATKSALNGGIVFTKSASTASSDIPLYEDINLNLKIPILKLNSPGGVLVNNDADSAIYITGSLKNMLVEDELNFATLGGIESAKMHFKGEWQIDVKIKGDFSITLGLFDQAWEDVEGKKFEKFGFKGDFSGLDSQDKVGKLPIAGLIFSSNCPTTCPVVPGLASPNINQAKVGGVIIWLYLTAKGEINIAGESGIRLRPAKISFGLKKEINQPFKPESQINRIENTGNMIDAPYVEGEISGDLFLGTSVDVDVFFSGIRWANAGMDVGFQAGASFGGSGSLGTQRLGADWQWNGNLCLNGYYGAGAVFRAALNLGMEVDSFWGDPSFNFEYKNQIPTDEQMRKPGRHYLWYTFDSADICLTSERPDLSVSQFETGASTAEPSEAITLTAQIANMGNVTSDSTTLRFARSTSPAFEISNTSVLCSQPVFSLAASATSAIITCNIQAFSIPNTYYYRACVDGVNNESNIGNNCSEPINITVTQPSTNNCTPQPITLGETVNGSWTNDCLSVNQNGSNARYYTFSLTSPQSVAIDLSSNIDNILYLIQGSDPYGSIIASNDDREPGNRNALIETTLQSDTYTIEATTYYENMTDSYVLKILGNQNTTGPNLDIVGFSLSEDSVEIGGLIHITAPVANNGAAPSSSSVVHFYQDGVELSNCTQTVPTLNAPGSEIMRCELNAPTAAGTYQYSACVDSVANETNMQDNCSQTDTLIVTDSGGNSFVSTGRLNDTGITRCGSVDGTSNDLACPVTEAPGQDAEYGRDVTHNDDSDGHAGFSFTKLDANGNPLPASATIWDCVKDNVTGLIWEVKTDDGGLRDKDNTYTWYEPDSTKNGGDPGMQNGGSCTGSSCDTYGYVQAVNAQGLCGASDWRMPTVDELYSLVYENLGLTIESNFFPNMPSNDFYSTYSSTYSNQFWSSSPVANASIRAWYVGFFGSTTTWGYKGNSKWVRLVRGEWTNSG